MIRDVFAFDSLRVLVESGEASHAAWLGEFLTPHFERRPGSDHDCRVELIEDAGRYRVALALGPAGGSLDAFAFDTRLVSLPRWAAPSDLTRLHDARASVVYEIAEGGRSITVLAEPGNPRSRTALMRVVRELATNRVQRRGGVLLHASAFAVGDRMVVLAGPKRAGKTTLLLHALRSARSRYVANDRVVVLPGTGPAKARGVPTIVSLRAGTLAMLPDLAGRLARTPYNYRATLDEIHPAGADASSSSPGGYAVTQAQLCRLLDARPRADGEIGAFVFPEITGEVSTLSLRRLTAADAAERLGAAIFGVPSSRSWSDVFSFPTGPGPGDRSALRERCRDLAARIPAFECRLGDHAYDSPTTADALLEWALR